MDDPGVQTARPESIYLSSSDASPPPTPELVEEAKKLREEIRLLYRSLVDGLSKHPTIQEECLEELSIAERLVGVGTLTTRRLIESRYHVVRVQARYRRSRTNRTSAQVVLLILYIGILAGTWGVLSGILQQGLPATVLNEKLFMGVPVPVWVWAVIGSLTSMLVRAGTVQFQNMSEALQWILSRPVVGVVMGVLVYLMVTAGLIVFAGSPDTTTPELIWVLAFVGAFSDTLSVNLLQRLVGKFEPIGRADGNGEPAESSETDPTAKNPLHSEQEPDPELR